MGLNKKATLCWAALWIQLVSCTNQLRFTEPLEERRLAEVLPLASFPLLAWQQSEQYFHLT